VKEKISDVIAAVAVTIAVAAIVIKVLSQ